ncbi:MAG: hypothetical protein L0K85_06630, partial [Staphylococcus simulans]|nr:hypothetical protein [Staphylococcus simulans]
MSGIGLLCNIENGVIKFERDASETEKTSCLAIMKSNPVSTKSKFKTDWVKFKKTFVSKFQAEFDHTDLSEVMEAKMVSSDLNPKVFGGILRAYIQQFFEEGIHESVSPGLKGFEYYYALDEINSKMDIWEQINLVSKLGNMRNITTPSQTEVEEYGKLLELIDYYVPLSHFNVIQFVSFIPKTERKDFLRELKLLEPENIINAANFRSQQLIRLYNNFKLKFSEEEEVNLVQKKKGYKRFCKTCKKRHFGKCLNKQEEDVNFAVSTLGYNSKSICSENDNYLVLVEQENEEVNLVEQNEEFLLDTGATVHVVNNINWLTNVKKCSMNIRTINAKKNYDTVGDVKLSDDLILKDAVYIKDSPRNIISLSLLNKEGYDSVQEECVCKIKLGNKVLCQVPLKEKLYVLDTNTLFDQQQVYFVLGNDSKSTRTFRDYGEMEDKVLNEILGPNVYTDHVLNKNEEPDWYCAHLKFGHASKNQLSTLGIKVKDKIPNYCLDCAGIVYKTIGKKSPEEYTEGEMLCVDLIGPIYNQ